VAIGERWSEIHGAEQGTYPSVDVRSLPMRRRQCSKAPCKTVCDNLRYFAIKRRPDGIVYLDPALCVGCQKCIPLSAQGGEFQYAEDQQAGPEGRRGEMQLLHAEARPGPAAGVRDHLPGVTVEYGDFNALRARHPDAKQTGDDAGSKMLYSNMGAKPKRRTASYPYPVPSHD